MPLSGSDIALPSTRLLHTGARILVVGLLLFALYYELNAGKNTGLMWETFQQRLSAANPLWLATSLLLMPVNWLAETAKWRLFLHRLQPLPWPKAFLGVMAGVSFGIFTPNRLGEFGGRLLLIERRHHWAALMANLAGSMAQFIVLLSAGVIGWYQFAGYFGYANEWILPLAGLLAAGTTLLIVAFFNLGPTLNLLYRIPIAGRYRKWMPDFRVLQQVSRPDLARVLAWSAFRYGVYATQYYCLLQFFGIEPGLAPAYAGIALIFLLQTTLPLPAVAGLLVRGNLAVFIWSHVGANEISSLATTFFLWIINLILPALLGTFSIFHVSITKTLENEDR
jgi:uncharacterized membrane protein YbhN (UPF0104 family)